MDETTEPNSQPSEVVDAPDFEFTHGVDGIEINEVVLSFIAGQGTEIKGVRFRPREGITGLALKSTLDKATIRKLVITIDRDESFPGVTFDAGPELLLCLQDREWRDKVVAETKAAWEAERAAAETPAALVSIPQEEVRPLPGLRSPEWTGQPVEAVKAE